MITKNYLITAMGLQDPNEPIERELLHGTQELADFIRRYLDDTMFSILIT